MKKTLLITLLLIVGYSKEPINGNELVEKDGVMYTKDTNIPYSGDVFGLYKNGQKKYEGTYKNGESIEARQWFEDGILWYEQYQTDDVQTGKREFLIK